MIIECKSCHARFRLDESKIRGRGARVKCRKCGDLIIVLRSEAPGMPSVSGEPVGEGSLDLGSVLRHSPGEEPAARREPPSSGNLIPFPGSGRVPETAELPDTGKEKDDVEAAFEKLLAETAASPAFGAPEAPPEATGDREPAGPASDASAEPVPAAEAPLSGDAAIADDRPAPPEFAPGERVELVSLLPETPAPQEEAPPGRDEAVFLISDSETLDFLSGASKEPGPGRDADISQAISSSPVELKVSLQPEMESSALPTTADLVPPPEEPFVEGNATPPAAPKESVPPVAPDLPPEAPQAQTAPQYLEATPARGGSARAASSRMLAAVVVLLVALLGAAGYFGFTEYGRKSFEDLAPRLAALVGWKVAAPSGPRYELKNVIGYYDSGAAAPRILVIKGQVTNLSRMAKSGIRVHAVLLDNKEQALAEQTVYAGNVLAGAKLKTEDRGALEKALANPFGDRLSNMDVQPGKTVPFMVLFFDAPESIDSYRLEAMDNR
ncbi:MAG: DUF3426 domain-containing protein [Verrucomicrobiota bacterium]